VDVVHLVAHGGFDGEHAVILLEDDDGAIQPVDEDQFMTVLRYSDSVKLVVLADSRRVAHGRRRRALRPCGNRAPSYRCARSRSQRYDCGRTGPAHRACVAEPGQMPVESRGRRSQGDQLAHRRPGACNLAVGCDPR
jgi:hypothetical protein